MERPEPSAGTIVTGIALSVLAVVPYVIWLNTDPGWNGRPAGWLWAAGLLGFAGLVTFLFGLHGLIKSLDAYLHHKYTESVNTQA